MQILLETTGRRRESQAKLDIQHRVLRNAEKMLFVGFSYFYSVLILFLFFAFFWHLIIVQCIGDVFFFNCFCFLLLHIFRHRILVKYLRDYFCHFYEKDFFLFFCTAQYQPFYFLEITFDDILISLLKVYLSTWSCGNGEGDL